MMDKTNLIVMYFLENLGCSLKSLCYFLKKEVSLCWVYLRERTLSM